jgi:acylphosphatase
MTKRAHVWIRGRVQGVFYRASTQRQALELGVRGWVRNLSDGRVEAWLEGDEPAVEAMLGWCRRGPPAAVVTDVEVEWGEPEGHAGFVVRR